MPWTASLQASLSLTISGVFSTSCPLSWWCHLTISSFPTFLSFCLQSFPASGSFRTSQLFLSCGQSIGTSASASVLSKNIQVWFPLRLMGFMSLQFKGRSKVSSSTTIWKHQCLGTQVFFKLSHPCMTTRKTITLTMDLCWQMMFLLYNAIFPLKYS